MLQTRHLILKIRLLSPGSAFARQPFTLAAECSFLVTQLFLTHASSEFWRAFNSICKHHCCWQKFGCAHLLGVLAEFFCGGAGALPKKSQSCVHFAVLYCKGPCHYCIPTTAYHKNTRTEQQQCMVAVKSNKVLTYYYDTIYLSKCWPY